MLPDRHCVNLVSSGMLILRPDRGWEKNADGGAAEGAPGAGAACGGRPTLPSSARCRDAHALPDDPAGGRWQARPTDRLDDTARTALVTGTAGPCGPRSVRSSTRASYAGPIVYIASTGHVVHSPRGGRRRAIANAHPREVGR